MSFKEKWQNEKNKLKPMNWKEKIGYIWEYYKLWIIGTLVIVIFSSSMISSMVKNSRPTYLYATFINASSYGNEDFDLIADFADYADVNTKKEQLSLDTTLQLSEGEEYDEMTYNSTMKLYAQIVAKSIDVMVMGKTIIDDYAAQDAFLALDETLPSDLYEKLQDQILTANNENGTSYECGIDISDSVVLQRSELYADTQTPVFSIVSNSEHVENAIVFLEYLYSQNDK